MGDKPVTDKPDTDKTVMDKPVTDKMVTDKPDMDKVATNKMVMDKTVMDKPDMVKPDTVKVVMDKPDTAIKTITTMTTGVKIMGTKNNLMVDTRKRSMNTNIRTTNISNHLMEGTKWNLDMDKPNMDKPVMDKPNTEKSNMEKRASIRPGPWHKTPFY